MSEAPLGTDPDVERAVDDLCADYERTGLPLELSQIERMASVRKLSFPQIEQIMDRLAVASVPVVGDSSDSDISVETMTTVPTGSDIDAHIRAMLDHRLLNADQEADLGRAMAAGRAAAHEILAGNETSRAREAVARGEQCRDQMASANYRLVWAWAVKYAAMTGLERLDLFQDGVIGLLRAVDKYDPEIGFRFSTYAVYWIRQAIQRAVADKGRTVRLPVWVHDQVLRLGRATRLLWRELGARPSIANLAEELAMDRDRVAFLQALAELVPASLDAHTLGGEGDPLVETIAGEQDTPEQCAEREELAEIVRRAIRTLPPGMREIMFRRAGIGNDRADTLETIGRSFGITRERVRQLEAKGLEKLRMRVPPMLGLAPIPTIRRSKTPKSGEQPDQTSVESGETTNE